MPRYRFDGFFETVLTGLSHGVNAVLHREKHGQPDGSTVVARPGDEVTSDAPYPHPHLVNLATGVPDLPVEAGGGQSPLVVQPDPYIHGSAVPLTPAAAPAKKSTAKKTTAPATGQE